jgi:YHS domain-containing protein
MRYLILFALLCLCYYVLKKIIFPTQRTYKIFKRYHQSSTDKELVQDPHCHTYISKETALRATIGGEVLYFCSQKCLEEYKKAHEVQDG